MRDFPPSDCSSRQVSSRRVRPLVGRQGAQPRRGGSGGQTLRWRLLMEDWARASSPDTAALTRPFTHRKRLQQRGHVSRRGWFQCSVSLWWCSHSDNVRQQQHRQDGAAMWRQREHQYSNSGQVMGQDIGSLCCLMPLFSHVTLHDFWRPITWKMLFYWCVRLISSLSTTVWLTILLWPRSKTCL